MYIEVLADGKTTRLEANPGDNLASVLVNSGVVEGTECNRGVCGKCAVRLISGDVTPCEEGEDITRHCAEGFILACRSLLKDQDLKIAISSGKDDINRKVRLPNLGRHHASENPEVTKFFLKLEPPSLNDQLSDLERVLNALAAKNSPGISARNIRNSLLPNLPGLLRDANFEVTAVLIDNDLAAVEPGDTTAKNYGFIVDIGTTTIAIYLVDMERGEALDAEGIANPQRAYGADVLSRISAGSTPESLKKLQDLVVGGIGETFEKMLLRNGVSGQNIYSVVVVGNTTMSHLFLGVEPGNLAIAPFVPCYRPRVELTGFWLRLPINPEAKVHVLANISGYVGSDTLGVAMATRPWERQGCSLAVDIGTNGEILLGVGDKLYACSAAAGPAFEGAHITQGMRAGEGAIEKIRFRDGKVDLKIIGDKPPKGICGSGLIDGVAELLRAKILEPSGRFTKNEEILATPLGRRLREGADGIREFVLAYKDEQGNDRDIVITLKDIRELQLAKAAIAAGIEILYKEAGIAADKVDRLFLAGAFGNYLDRENAVALGVFPGIPVEKIIPVGNAAAEGAGVCLMSVSELLASDEIAANVRPIELSTRADFNDLWIRCINFPANRN